MNSNFPTIRNRRTRRRGQALVEFALVAIALYILIAGTLTFGMLIYHAQGTQQAADLCAREISRTALPANSITLEDVLRGNAITSPFVGVQTVRKHIYNEHYLVLNLDSLHGFASLAELQAALPVVNRQLVPLMIYDEIRGTRVLRYPGAVFTDTDNSDDPSTPEPSPSGWLVAIPLVTARTLDGVETIDWIPVVEEIDSATNADPFKFNFSSPEQGIVALRINYPFQAAAMSSFRESPDGRFESNLSSPNVADDSAVNVVDLDGYSPSGTLVPSDFEYGPYAGSLGLGKQAALGSQELTDGRPVRPYRRVISAQAIYRREVFE